MFILDKITLLGIVSFIAVGYFLFRLCSKERCFNKR